jgi:hypothetical protein
MNSCVGWLIVVSIGFFYFQVYLKKRSTTVRANYKFQGLPLLLVTHTACCMCICISAISEYSPDEKRYMCTGNVFLWILCTVTKQTHNEEVVYVHQSSCFIYKTTRRIFIRFVRLVTTKNCLVKLILISIGQLYNPLHEVKISLY